MRTAASNEDRTRDLLLTKEMLCQLSYRGITDATKKFGCQKMKMLWTKKKPVPAPQFGVPKRNLHVRESNPGRLRDRQKCYQLHQRGKPPARIELATLRLLSACSARLSYRGGGTAPDQDRTGDLGIMRPTRCQLRHRSCSSAFFSQLPPVTGNFQLRC